MDHSPPADDTAVTEPVFSTNLLELNDDCLIAMFRILPLGDLSSVASTCTQLNAIACTVFKLKPTAKRCFDLPQMRNNAMHSGVDIKAIQYLQNFGHLLDEAKLDMKCIDALSNLVFEEIVKYSGGSELQKLQMSRIQLAPKLIPRAVHLFENLKSLNAVYSYERPNDFFVQLLSKCAKLEDLHLVHCLPTAGHLSKLFFPNLTEFSFSQVNTGRWPLALSIEQFLLRHIFTIKKLKLTNLTGFNLAIFVQMPVLEELELRLRDSSYVQDDYYTEGNRFNLKKILVKNVDKPISRFLNSLAPQMANSLEQLDFYGETDDLFIECIRNYQNLVSVKVADCDDRMTAVMNNLKNSIATLTHLDLGLSPVKIDGGVILALSQFRHLLTLKIRAHGIFIDSGTFDALKTLKKITNFSYTGRADAATNLLKYLGSVRTMKQICLCISALDGRFECFQILNRFSNLQVLVIVAHEEYIPMLNAIDGFNELIELSLDLVCAFGCSCGCKSRCEWNGIVNLFRRLPKLSKLQLKGYREYLQFNLIIYSEFVDICRARGAKLIIEFIEYDCRCLHISADILEVYGDHCRYAEIQMTPEVKETDFLIQLQMQ